jgi:hypothetical protein
MHRVHGDVRSVGAAAASSERLQRSMGSDLDQYSGPFLSVA